MHVVLFILKYVKIKLDGSLTSGGDMFHLEEDASIIRCEQCKKEIIEKPLGMELRLGKKVEVHIFCSWDCCIAWASDYNHARNGSIINITPR